MTSHRTPWSQFRRIALFRVAVFAATPLLNPSLLEAAANIRTFDIAAESAERTLRQFSVQSDAEVVFSTEATNGIRTNALKGSYPTDDALRRLLDGTGLAVTQDGPSGIYTITRQPGGLARPSAAPRPDTPRSNVAERGALTGRIYNPATGEYVRNAQVEIIGNGLATTSEDGGVFHFPQVPAGPVTVRVSYTGYRPITAVVAIAPDTTAQQDFELVSAITPSATTVDTNTLQMSAFVVSSEREGNAKAIQEQKNAMNIMSHVASDVFGDVPEGNVGEFLKFMPGVELDYVQADARGVRLRGMDPQYVNVTMDGVKLASADAFGATVGTENNGTEGSRAFGFESVSLSSVDSIEVFKTLTSDMDADAPAGTINLRSKRAFDRAGRRVLWQVTLSGNSEELHFDRTFGPGDNRHYKIRPGGILEYSDVFLNKRLGVVFNLTRSDVYNEQYFFRTTINRQTLTTDTRTAVPTQIQYVDSPKLTERLTGTLTIDYKASARLNFGLTTTVSKYEATTNEHAVTLNLAANNTGATGRHTVLGDDPMLRFETSPHAGSNITLGGTGFVKLTDSVTFAPRFDYKPFDKLLIEGRFSHSYSNNDYEGLARGQARQANLNGISGTSGLVFRGERPSIDSSHWKISQVSGPDWSNLANFTRPQVNDEGRLDINKVVSGRIDATLRIGHKWLNFLKTGIKVSEESRDFRDERNWNQWEYIGPGGAIAGQPNTGSWVDYPGTTPLDLGPDIPASISSISGEPPTVPGKTKIAELFRQHPEYFTRTPFETAANYYSSFIGNTRDLNERVDAAYLTGGTRFRALQVQAGLRWEETNTLSVTFDQRSRDDVAAAGFAVRNVNATTGAVTYTLPGTTINAFDANSRHVQIPGLQYQFETLPRKRVRGNYENLFPSLVAKYTIARNLIAQAGYNQAISRPSLTSLAGPITVNENNFTISIPNAGLLPEESKNLSARFAYYFEPVGTLSVGVFQNTISNIRNTFEFEEPEDFARFGLDPNEYPGYVIRSTLNGSGTRRFRGMEFEYRQSLSFLPGVLGGFNVFANYTRNYADQRRGGLVPHQISGGTSYGWKRLSASARVVWTPDTPWTQNIVQQYRAERLLLDLSASYRVTDRITVSLSGRNITNEPHRRVEDRPEGRIVANEEFYGTAWSMSIRGTF